VRYYIDIQAYDTLIFLKGINLWYRNELGNFPPVESAASIMREIIYNNKNSLSASMICSGWDPYKGY
jgi:20S proteasome subunit beta 1